MITPSNTVTIIAVVSAVWSLLFKIGQKYPTHSHVDKQLIAVCCGLYSTLLWWQFTILLGFALLLKTAGY